MTPNKFLSTCKPYLGVGLIVSFSALIPLSFASDNDLLKPDSELVQGCAACHGVDGNSSVSIFPNLAGQMPGHLVHELMEFKNKFRHDDAMSPAVESLSKKDIDKLAEYFSSQKPVLPTPAEPIDPKLIAEGKVLYTTERGNPLACSDCHGRNGEGNEATRLTRAFPRVAGQQYDYLVSELQKYYGGQLTHGLPVMRRAGHALSENDIKALAAYLATLD